MKPNELKINKQFIYILIIVLVVIFGLFFLNNYSDLAASTFTVKTNSPQGLADKITGGTTDVDNMDENFEKYFNR